MDKITKASAEMTAGEEYIINILTSLFAASCFTAGTLFVAAKAWEIFGSSIFIVAAAALFFFFFYIFLSVGEGQSLAASRVIEPSPAVQCNDKTVLEWNSYIEKEFGKGFWATIEGKTVLNYISILEKENEDMESALNDAIPSR